MDAPRDEPAFFAALRWTADGLIPAIVQDGDSGAVLMMAWMDRAALLRTIETGQTHFYSRSRRAAWHKGGTSGHVQAVRSIAVDCDGDTLLIRVAQAGGACHEGYRSCFFREVEDGATLRTTSDRVFNPGNVYQASP